jgi:phosphopantetheine adenylyltransferase
VRVTKIAVIRIKTDLSISYGLARNKFEEQFDLKKETYAHVTARNDDQMQKEQEKGLAAIKERQRNMKEMTEKIERENEELKRLTNRLIKAIKTQKYLNEKFAQLR